jgi:hypothetical protein
MEKNQEEPALAFCRHTLEAMDFKAFSLRPTNTSIQS